MEDFNHLKTNIDIIINNISQYYLREEDLFLKKNIDNNIDRHEDKL